MEKEMKAYWESMKNHPGVAPAFLFSLMLLVVVIQSYDPERIVAIFLAAIFFLLMWGIVLFTGWTNRHQFYEEEQNDGNKSK